ncbi:MAG: hypothetical protein JO043_12945 [Candidatus Eremiobacteraeota bacterium]|nr:hypothetical protein [Candidatus Eremiobacteraeota bacterium]
MRDAGCEIEIADADDQEFRCFCGPYDGILSTHALLHGTCETVASRVAILTAYIREGGRFHATFGSTLDPRCGVGVYLEGDGWSSQDGPEAGVPHAFFHRAALEALLRPFSAGSMEEREVGEVVGRWAHPAHDPARPAFHWFVEAAR